MTKIEMVRGVVMPFFPMRPMSGSPLRTTKQVERLYEEVHEPDEWICQPKLGGDRACLGVLDDQVYVQNRHGGWYGHEVKNELPFLKLPNRTVLDGEVYNGCFYAFDALAVAGHSFIRATAGEREVMAFQMMKLIGQPWLFGTPTRDWFLNRRSNLPKFDGVVLKLAASAYAIRASDTQLSTEWIKRTWA